MCTVLLPPGGYPIAVNKYIYANAGHQENEMTDELAKEAATNSDINL